MNELHLTLTFFLFKNKRSDTELVVKMHFLNEMCQNEGREKKYARAEKHNI